MSRDISAAFQSAIESANVYPFLAVRLVFDSGTTRLWSGIGDISFDTGSGSETFNGAGELMSVVPANERNDVTADGAKFALSGVPSAMLAIALDESYQGRNAKLYLGLQDVNGAVIADPYILFSGSMDSMQISDTGNTASIQVSVESRLVSLQRKRERRYTTEDQKLIDITDKGFDFMPDLQDKVVQWGSGKGDQGLPPAYTIPDNWGPQGPLR